MSLVDEIKASVRKSGANKGKFIYFKSGIKIRVRFLTDMEDGLKTLFHDSFAESINIPCQELFNRACPHHEDEALRHRELYSWSVWDYEAKEVKILMGAVNNCSPIPLLVGMYDTYGTITDRDYVITKSGAQTSTSFSVVPMDKVKFRNEKAKPYSESKILSLMDKAFPADDADKGEDEDEDDTPVVRKKHTKKKPVVEEEDEDFDDEDEEEPVAKKKHKKAPAKPEPEEEDDEEEDDEDEDKYADFTAIELYKQCKKRKIKVLPKKSEKYYILKLEALDNADDEEDSDEEIDW